MGQVVCAKHDEQGMICVDAASHQLIKLAACATKEDWVLCQVNVEPMFNPWVLFHKKYLKNYNPLYEVGEFDSKTVFECTACISAYLGEEIGSRLKIQRIALK
ncbi:MAG: hypothetical protein AAGJ93_09165 [Bacteroidota bacterium]